MLYYEALKGVKKKIYKLENAASCVCLFGIFFFFYHPGEYKRMRKNKNQSLFLQLEKVMSSVSYLKMRGSKGKSLLLSLVVTWVTYYTLSCIIWHRVKWDVWKVTVGAFIHLRLFCACVRVRVRVCVRVCPAAGWCTPVSASLPVTLSGNWILPGGANWAQGWDSGVCSVRGSRQRVPDCVSQEQHGGPQTGSCSFNCSSLLWLHFSLIILLSPFLHFTENFGIPEEAD